MPDVHGLNVLSVYDPLSGTVVQLNALGQESEVLVRGVLDADGVETPTGGRYYGGDHSRISVQFLEVLGTEYAQLDAWMKEGRRVSAAGVGPTGALLWEEKDLLTVMPESIKGAQGGARGFRLEMERKGHASHKIYWHNDLLDRFGWPLALPLPAGYTYYNANIGEEDDSLFSVNAISSGTGSALDSPKILFPVAGVRLTGSVGYAGAAGNSWLGGVGALTKGSLSVGSAYENLQAAGDYPDNRMRVEYVTSPGTYYVFFSLAYSPTGVGYAFVRRPALRVGTSGEAGRSGPPR